MARIIHSLAAFGLVLFVVPIAVAVDAYDDEVCNPYTETRTDQIAIKWKNRPYDCKDFFKDKDIDLEWEVDWGDDWTVYTAEDVETANAIMSDILAILEGANMYGDSPMRDPDTHDAIKHKVAAVYGSCIDLTFASQPAALPNECPANTCPTQGLWGLNTIRAPAVWASLPGIVNDNPTASVMVLDGGVRATHNDLAGNLVPTLLATAYRGVVAQPPEPGSQAITSHGTHVSGTVFARWNNGQGTPVGVVGRALGGSCGCGVVRPDGNVGIEGLCQIGCIRLATERRVSVINFSFGGPEPPSAAVGDARREAIEAFCRQGGIITIAAGNGEPVPAGSNNFVGFNIQRPGSLIYPSSYAVDLAATFPTCIINVANLQRDGSLAQNSNFGSAVQVAAPGTDKFSAESGSDTDTSLKSGTSMAAPHVAGMAALLFNAFPGATQAQVYRCIVSTATGPWRPDPNTPGPTIAGCVVNLEAAYNCMQNNPTCPRTGLPACVDPSSGQPVQQCDTDTTRRFCRQIPGNTRFVCQYSYRAEGALCRTTNTIAAAALASEDFSDADDLIELSAEEVKAMGLEAEPPAETMSEEQTVTAGVMGASEVQQAGRKPTQRDIQACGQCRNRQCVAAARKWCKSALKRSALPAESSV